MQNLALLIGIMIIPLYIIWGIVGYRSLKNDRSKIIQSYKNTIISNIVIVGIIMLISPYANFQTDFFVLGKGVSLLDTETIYGMFTSIVIITLALPFLMERFKDRLPTNQGADFSDLLPQNKKEYIWFFFMVSTVAIGEELIFREFYFELLNQSFHLRGDILLLVSAIIFAVVHAYQGVWGILATFFLGLVLGKIFQSTESLLIPIILHFIIDIKFLWNIAVKKFLSRRKNQKTY